MSILRRFGPALALAGLALVAAPRPAQAVLTLTLQQTGNGTGIFAPQTLVVLDNGAGDQDPTLGVILFSQDFGAFTDAATDGVVITARSNAPGNPVPQIGAILSTTELAIRGPETGSATLVVTTFDDPATGSGFTNPPGSPLLLNSSLAQSFFFAGTESTAGASTSLSSQLLSDAGAVAGTSPLLTLATAGQANNLISVTRPGSIFDLRQITTVTLGTQGQANFVATTQATVAAVPEPATIAMFLSALPMIGVGVLRRRRAA